MSKILKKANGLHLWDYSTDVDTALNPTSEGLRFTDFHSTYLVPPLASSPHAA